MYGRRSIQHTREPTVGHSLIDLSAEETDEYLISLDLPVLMEDRQAQVSYHSFVNPTQGPEVQAEVQQPGGGSSEGRESSRTPITQPIRFRGRGRGRQTPRVGYTAEDWDRITPIAEGYSRSEEHGDIHPTGPHGPEGLGGQQITEAGSESAGRAGTPAGRPRPAACAPNMASSEPVWVSPQGSGHMTPHRASESLPYGSSLLTSTNVRQSSDNRPTNVRQPSDNRLTNVRQPSDQRATAVRQLSDQRATTDQPTAIGRLPLDIY